jgi:multiple sugar transport system permease protein
MATAGVSMPKKRRFSRIALRQNVLGYLWISPWLLGFFFFILGPMMASVGYSFTNYRIVNEPRFVGLGNYVTALTTDSLFWPSMGRTFLFMLISVPIGVAASLLLAILLNQRLRGETLYRTFFFLPTLTPLAAAAILWTWILHPDVGMMNYLLSLVGIDGPAWLASTRWAMPSIVMITLWTSIGGGRMIIFLAGLQGVPQELYESASIDGAGAWSKFWNITLPMISPALFFNMILGIIAALQVFTTAYITTRGGPGRATWFYALHIYTNAFEYFDMGYASALAIILFVVLLIFTLIQLRLSNRWVFYAGG